MRFPAHIRRGVNVALFSTRQSGSCITLLSGTSLDGNLVVVDGFSYPVGNPIDDGKCGERGDPSVTWELGWISRDCHNPFYFGIEEFTYSVGANLSGSSGGPKWDAAWGDRVTYNPRDFGLDTFTYTVGEGLNAQSGGTSWDQPWNER